MGCVANVLHFGATNIRKTCYYGLGNFCGVVHTQGGLRDYSEAFGLFGLNMGDICNIFNQINAIYQLAHRALNFRMAFMADHHEFITLFVQLGDFHMYLGHQRTSGIEHGKAALRSFCFHRFRYTMRAKNQGSTRRHIFEVFYEYGATAFEVIHHIGVMDDFMAHIDRRAKFQQRTVDDFNGTVNSCTKSSGFRQYDFLKALHIDLQNSDDLHFKRHSPTSKRMVEVKQHRVIRHLLNGTCK